MGLFAATVLAARDAASDAAAAAAAAAASGEPSNQPSFSPYGYTPALANCIAFTVVFSLLTIVHLGLGLKFRSWASIGTMVVGGLLEIIGWAARLWSAKNPLLWDNFIMQITTLIIAPVFATAWCYTLLGACIAHLGPQYGVLGPKWYLFIFLTADIIALILQAVGGGGAAVQAQNGDNTDTNTSIMLAGILFQLVAITVFVVLAIDFMWRVVANKPYAFRERRIALERERRAEHAAAALQDKDHPVRDAEGATMHSGDSVLPGDAARRAWLKKAQLLLMGVGFATLMIYMRGIYRSIELAEGWDGRIITTERYFVWLDGFPMVLCWATLAVFHPGWLLPRTRGSILSVQH